MIVYVKIISTGYSNREVHFKSDFFAKVTSLESRNKLSKSFYQKFKFLQVAPPSD